MVTNGGVEYDPGEETSDIEDFLNNEKLVNIQYKRLEEEFKQIA